MALGKGGPSAESGTLPSNLEGPPSAESGVIEEKNQLRDSVKIDIGFESFYKLYPRKTNKPGALRAWKKIKPDAALRPRIMDRLKTFIAIDWSRTEPNYIPHPATWLNGRRWEDQIIQPATPKRGEASDDWDESQLTIPIHRESPR